MWGLWTISNWVSSLRVELDDQLLFDRGVDLFTAGKVPHGDATLAEVDIEPFGGGPVHRVDGVLDDHEITGRFLDGDDVALFDLERRDVDLPPVDLEVAVVHELTGLGTGRCQAGTPHDVVE